MIWTQGFIKGWALGKLLWQQFCPPGLIIYKSVFLTSTRRFSSVKTCCPPAKNVNETPYGALKLQLSVLHSQPFQRQTNTTYQQILFTFININYFQTFLWSQKLNWKCAKSHCGEWNNGCPEISVIHTGNNYFTSMHWIWVHRQSIQDQVGHNHLISNKWNNCFYWII